MLTKQTDTRYRWWAGQSLGARCWELDAMAPAVLRDRVEDFIVRHLDLELWERAREVEAAEIESMRSITTRMQDLISGPATEYGGAP